MSKSTLSKAGGTAEREAGPRVNPEALRALRIKDGYSVAAFAREIGIVPSHLSNVESGRRGLSPATTKRAAQVLGVPISALLWREAA